MPSHETASSAPVPAPQQSPQQSNANHRPAVMASVSPPTRHVRPPASTGADSSATAATRATTPAAVVSVVDDDASVRRSLVRLIRAAGYDVDAFASAGDFLDAPAPARPACVLLDVRMPRMTGLDLQQELARRGRSIPIVFLTGHGDVPMAARAMKAGAVDFLLKPFKDGDLLDAIARAVARAAREFVAGAERDRILSLIDSLTARERQVLTGVVRGRLNKQIAYDLGVTEATIKLHRGRVMEKMGVESLAELVHLVDRVEGIPATRDQSPAING
jgi:FixJ family two-component response regulator